MQPFLIALGNSPTLYLLALLLCAVAVIGLARPTITTVYDPWVLQLIQTAFASAAVVFMAFAGVIAPSLMLYHIAAIGGFLLFGSLVYKAMTHQCFVARRVRPRTLNSMRRLFLLLLVVSQLAAWTLAGVPLLLESRLNAFASGGGVGVLSRVLSFLSFATVFLTVLRVGITSEKRLNRTDLFVLIFTVLASVANASKTSILLTLLLILTSHWIFRHIIRDYVGLQVSRKKLVAAGLALVMLMMVPVLMDLSREPESTIGGPIEAIVLRLIFSGDGYMWMYGDDYLSTVTVSSPTALMFTDFLGVTRLVPWEQLPVHPGLQIFQHLFPGSEAIRGPNLRVDTFGLLYGSMPLGVIISVSLGCIFGLLRGWLFKVRSAVIFLPAAYLFFQAPTFLVDPMLGVTALVNTVFAAVIVALVQALVGRDPFTSGVRRRMRRRRPVAMIPAPATETAKPLTPSTAP